MLIAVDFLQKRRSALIDAFRAIRHFAIKSYICIRSGPSSAHRGHQTLHICQDVDLHYLTMHQRHLWLVFHAIVWLYKRNDKTVKLEESSKGNQR